MGMTRININGNTISLGIDARRIDMKTTDMARVVDSADLKSELETKYGKVLPIAVFYHKNRDGTLAVATGVEPLVWTEDEVHWV